MGRAHIVIAPANNMKNSIIFCVFCLVGELRAAPAADVECEKIVFPKNLFDKSLIKYKAAHDIVDIIVPLNALNFSYPSDSDSKNETNEKFIKDLTIFLVEADIQNGNRVDRGLFVFKNGHAKNILPTGRTAVAANAYLTKKVFFGASNGLYAYDVDSNSAIKYGPITDGIISIAADEEQNIIYILTDDHKLYEVSNNGEKKDLVGNVEDAQEIVLDYYHNIYYYNSNKEVFVHTFDGVVQVKGLPPNPNSLKLIRAPFIIEKGVPVMSDNSLYFVFANGTSEAANVEFSPDAIPTAYGPEALLVQYYAFNKKLYEYNFMPIMSQSLPDVVKDKTEIIHSKANSNLVLNRFVSLY